ARFAGWAAFGICLLGYSILSCQQPADWPMALWVLFAFILLPLLAGYASGRTQGAEPAGRSHFWTAARPTAFAMFWYTAFNLMYLRTRVSSGGRSEDIFLVGFFVSAVYGTIAGLVGGLAASNVA